jgi:hypothetical protein
LGRDDPKILVMLSNGRAIDVRRGEKGEEKGYFNVIGVEVDNGLGLSRSYAA